MMFLLQQSLTKQNSFLDLTAPSSLQFLLPAPSAVLWQNERLLTYNLSRTVTIGTKCHAGINKDRRAEEGRFG